MEYQSDGLQRRGYEGNRPETPEQEATPQDSDASPASESPTRSTLQLVAQEASRVSSLSEHMTDDVPRSVQANFAGDFIASMKAHNRHGIVAAESPERRISGPEMDTIIAEEMYADGLSDGESDVWNPEEEEEGHSIMPGHDGLSSTIAQPDDTVVDDVPCLTGSPSIVDSVTPRIQAFAKLEFDDGEFYMNTYSVELGRDLSAARIAHGRDYEDSQLSETRRRRPSDSGGELSPVSKKSQREGGRHLAGSVISESGGIIGAGSQDVEPPRRKSKGKKSKSTSSSSQQLSRKGSMVVQKVHTDYQSLAMWTGPDGESGIDSLPPPDACPLIPIHPPAVAEGIHAGHKSISRRHVRIAFNFEKRLFEVIIIGRNGAFVEDQWLPEGNVQPLKSGNLIQIGGVSVRFLLPDVALGETGAETNTRSSRVPSGMMSFEFEDGMGESDQIPSDSEDSSSEDVDDESNEDVDEESNDDDDDDEEEEQEEDDDDGRMHRRGGETEEAHIEDNSAEEEPEVLPPPKIRGKPKAKAKSKVKMKPKPKPKPKPKLKAITIPEPNPEPAPPIPKRRGPGRPPKNGVISKREQALLIRIAKEEAKAAALKESGAPPDTAKGKALKDVNLEGGLVQPSTGKRKYTKRKSKDVQPGELNGARESTEHTDSVPPEQTVAPKPPKEKKPPKPPRSPSPVYDESTMTPEQLAKPQSSYVVLIHEALTNSKTGAMSLPQIYRAIERRYPFYKLRVQTTGWQSSVRHNLSQHAAFRKIERDGKGWMWGLVPEISIEKEKKRRPSPPTLPQQHYYQPNPQMMQHPYQYAGMSPHNGHIPPMHHPPYGVAPGQRPLAPPGTLPHSLVPHGLALPFVNTQADTSSTYQSPYQSSPPIQSQLPAQPQPQPQPAQPFCPAQPPPSAPPAQSPQFPYTNGYNGYYTPNFHQPPASTPLNTKNHPPHPPPSPTPYSQHPLNPLPSRPPNTNNNAPPTTNAINPEVLQAITKFKTVLINSMSDNPRREALVSSAIARTLNPQLPSATKAAEDEHPQEKAIMQALSRMLDDLNKKTHVAQAQDSQPPPPTVTTSFIPQQQQPTSTTPNPHVHSQPPPTPQQQGPQAHLVQLLQQIGNRPGASTPPPNELNLPVSTSGSVPQPSNPPTSLMQSRPDPPNEAASGADAPPIPAIPDPPPSVSAAPESTSSGDVLPPNENVNGKRTLSKDNDERTEVAKRVDLGVRESRDSLVI